MEDFIDFKPCEFFTLENLIKFRSFLPGFLVYKMAESKECLSFDRLLDMVTNELESLRKTDGSKYCKNPSRALKSILSCSGIFYKINNEDHYVYWFYQDKAKEFLLNRKSSEKPKTRRRVRLEKNPK